MIERPASDEHVPWADAAVAGFEFLAAYGFQGPKVTRFNVAVVFRYDRGPIAIEFEADYFNRKPMEMLVRAVHPGDECAVISRLSLFEALRLRGAPELARLARETFRQRRARFPTYAEWVAYVRPAIERDLADFLRGSTAIFDEAAKASDTSVEA